MTTSSKSLITASHQNPKFFPPTNPARDISTMVERIFSIMKSEQVDHRTWSISEKLAPSPEQRQVLATRGRELAGHLKPVESAEAVKVITALVSRLLASYPQLQRVSHDDAKAMMGTYVEALTDMPLWAVKAACDGWVRGEGDGNKAFAPSASEIRALASRKQMPFRQEYEQIRRILGATVRKEPTEDERKRAAARIDAILQGFTAARNDTMQRPARDIADRTMPQSAPPSPAQRPNATPPVVSPALQEKFSSYNKQVAL